MISRGLLLFCLTALPAVAQERAFAPGTYGEPFTVAALVDGCSAEGEGAGGEGAGCTLIAEGVRWMAWADGPTPPELLAQLAALPVNSPVIVTGDMISMGDITVEAALAGIAPGSDPYATERAAMQGLWQGDDPGFAVTVRGSTWSEAYVGDVLGDYLLTLGEGCGLEGVEPEGLAISLQLLGGDPSEQTSFAVTSITAERMELLHLPRGNPVVFLRPQG